jgi:endonuclease/exonuclease/phosphatase family metal-dependent hydrolase
MVAIAAVAWASSLRIPAGPAAGTSFDGPAAGTAGARDTFRVGIFNIHGGRGKDSRRDLNRTADDVRGLDIIGLNEVLGPKLWWQTDQCQQLGEALGVAWLFAPTESRWWDGSFGNGMLSDLPVVSWQRIPLPRAGAHTYRNVVLSTIDVGSRRVHLLLAHLDSRDSRRRQEQLRTIGDLFLSLAPPAILMGDMNTPPGDPQLKQLLGTSGVADALAATTAAIPPQRIDWILTRGLRTVASGCDDHGASDHPLYWAELEIVD